MDLDQFRDALATALSRELRFREAAFAVYTMRSFNLGVHPWHGYIEPSFFTTEDSCSLRQIGDWKLYNFAFAGRPWPDVAKLAEWMRSFYEESRDQNADKLFRVAAQVLKALEVRKALSRFRATEEFFVSVYNPDNRSFRNYCDQA